jgi:glucose/arabinose dehydrogenase
LLQPHSASLGMAFFEASMFPSDFRGDAFAAEHGSWNRSRRTGYEVIRERGFDAQHRRRERGSASASRKA